MAGRQGFEPRYADPESAVLPLDDLPVRVLFLQVTAENFVVKEIERALWRDEIGTAGELQQDPLDANEDY
jgi:hypothetical protein